jgi:hypothetical protein
LLGGDVQRPSTESQDASSAVTTRVWGRTNRKNRKIKQLKLAAIVKSTIQCFPQTKVDL